MIIVCNIPPGTQPREFDPFPGSDKATDARLHLSRAEAVADTSALCVRLPGSRTRTREALMRWFFQQRMEWIAETLRVFGFINREHLERKFDISTPQASNDLQAFQALNPGTMTYDKSAKRYIAASVTAVGDRPTAPTSTAEG